MTRPLRTDVEGGWYHVMSRGIERRTIFVDMRRLRAPSDPVSGAAAQGLSLHESGALAGGMDYKNVSTRMRRFKQRLAEDRRLRGIADPCMARMTNDES